MHDQTRTAEAYIREVVNIPENLNVESIIAIGYPGEQKPSHPKESLQYEKVCYDYYGK
jgi:hypothetical protein